MRIFKKILQIRLCIGRSVVFDTLSVIKGVETLCGRNWRQNGNGTSYGQREWAEMMVWEELDAGTKKVLTMQKLDAHIIKKNSRSTSCSTK
jgi:hypothetical protein